jgi:hypothetical protein
MHPASLFFLSLPKMATNRQYPALNRHKGAASLAHVFVLETQHIRTVSRAHGQHFGVDICKPAQSNSDIRSRHAADGSHN